ncbi:hypothetical protein AGATL06_05950 [Agathobaculum sp. TL06]
MKIQERKANILINKAGGTAGPEGKNYRVILPAAWVKQLGITKEDREVLLQFDGECITFDAQRRQAMKTLWQMPAVGDMIC